MSRSFNTNKLSDLKTAYIHILQRQIAERKKVMDACDVIRESQARADHLDEEAKLLKQEIDELEAKKSSLSSRACIME